MQQLLVGMIYICHYAPLHAHTQLHGNCMPMCAEHEKFFNKLAPYGTDGRLLLTANLLQSHVVQKFGQKSTIRPDNLQVLSPNLRIRGHVPAPIINGEEIAVENGRFSDCHGLVTLTLTLTLDRVILHTVMHHSSTSTNIPNFIEIKVTFCGRTDGHTDGHLKPTLLGRLGGVDLKMSKIVPSCRKCQRSPLCGDLPIHEM